MQAQNDNRIQLTLNGLTARINLSLCRTTNDFIPSRKTEFLIAHCSLCSGSHCQRHTDESTASAEQMSKPLCHPSRNGALNNSLSRHPYRKIADIFELCDGTHSVETWLICGSGEPAGLPQICFGPTQALFFHMTLLAKSLCDVLSKSNPTEHLPSVLPPPE